MIDQAFIDKLIFEVLPAEPIPSMLEKAEKLAGRQLNDAEKEAVLEGLRGYNLI